MGLLQCVTWSFHTEDPADGHLRHAAPPMDLKPHHPRGLSYRANRDGGGLGRNEPTYVEYVEKKLLHYWFHYANSYNPTFSSAFTHEGDWEHIAIKLDSSTNRPTWVQYFYHHNSCRLPWARVPKTNGHPIVHVAREAHGSYPPGARTVLGDDIMSGPLWNTAINVKRVKEEPWWGYTGGWGEVGQNSLTTGPRGPNPQRSRESAPSFGVNICVRANNTGYPIDND